MPGYGPINMKSAYIDTSALTANTVYRLSRADEAFVVPDYDTDADYAAGEAGVQHGMMFQNRTSGVMYIWYGEVPTALQVPAEFIKAAYKVEAGATFQPPMSQIGLCYAVFATPAAGFVHHLSH